MDETEERGQAAIKETPQSQKEEGRRRLWTQGGVVSSLRGRRKLTTVQGTNQCSSARRQTGRDHAAACCWAETRFVFRFG